MKAMSCFTKHYSLMLTRHTHKKKISLYRRIVIRFMCPQCIHKTKHQLIIQLTLKVCFWYFKCSSIGNCKLFNLNRHSKAKLPVPSFFAVGRRIRNGGHIQKKRRIIRRVNSKTICLEIFSKLMCRILFENGIGRWTNRRMFGSLLFFFFFKKILKWIQWKYRSLMKLIVWKYLFRATFAKQIKLKSAELFHLKPNGPPNYTA